MLYALHTGTSRLHYTFGPFNTNRQVNTGEKDEVRQDLQEKKRAVWERKTPYVEARLHAIEQ